MLKQLQKFFAGNTAQPAQAETQEDVTTMTDKEGQVVLTAETNAMELVSQLASATESLVTMQSQFAELTDKFEKAQAALSEIEAAKQQLITDAAAAKLTARKEKLEATLGTEKSAEVLAATSTLDDVSFEAIASAFALSMDKEANSAMFKETGVAAEATPVENDTAARLEKRIAAQYK